MVHGPRARLLCAIGQAYQSTAEDFLSGGRTASIRHGFAWQVISLYFFKSDRFFVPFKDGVWPPYGFQLGSH